MNNPEFRQTLHNLSHNFENANQAAQENIYTFTQGYIDPCLAAVKSCLADFTAPCFPTHGDNLRRKRGRSRGRAEYNFDFYDAWDDEEAPAQGDLRWGDDELDSLLAGHGPPPTGQPRRQRAMSYGSRGRRKLPGVHPEAETDPTIIPSSSYLGFLERLPWKIGVRQLRYKPSAADLQVNPGGTRVRDDGGESEPLIEEREAEAAAADWSKGHGRQRSDTVASRSTTNSLSSRGDLIMSDEEDDAVPLDDEFTVMLSRRMTNQGLIDEQSSGKSHTPNGKRPGASRRSTRTMSSRSLASPGSKGQRSASQRSLALRPPDSASDLAAAPTMVDLRRQEEEVEREEELEIKQKREAAHRLAAQRGLDAGDFKHVMTAEAPSDSPPDGSRRPSLAVPDKPADATTPPSEQPSPSTQSIDQNPST